MDGGIGVHERGRQTDRVQRAHDLLADRHVLAQAGEDQLVAALQRDDRGLFQSGGRTGIERADRTREDAQRLFEVVIHSTSSRW